MEVTARIFMPLFVCPSNRCKINQTKGNLILQLRASKFLRFKEASFGDIFELSGIFLSIPYTGFRAMCAGLITYAYLEAMYVMHFKKSYEE